MNPVAFPEANVVFGPPSDLEESQCARIPAYRGQAAGGSVDGSPMIVVAWVPTEEECKRIANGGSIFLTMLGGLAPHFLSTSFPEAINPA